MNLILTQNVCSARTHIEILNYHRNVVWISKHLPLNQIFDPCHIKQPVLSRLSSRSQNTLRLRKRVLTDDALLALSCRDLLALPNFGAISLDEVLTILVDDTHYIDTGVSVASNQPPLHFGL